MKSSFVSKKSGNIEIRLENEIKKWTKRLEKELETYKIKKSVDNKHFLDNIKAYLNDSKYFYEKGDLIRSFEAIIWAWAWWEILKEVKKFDSQNHRR